MLIRISPVIQDASEARSTTRIADDDGGTAGCIAITGRPYGGGTGLLPQRPARSVCDLTGWDARRMLAG